MQCRHYCHQKLSRFYYGQVKAKSHEWDAFCMISRDYNSHSPLKEFLAKYALTFYPTVPVMSSCLSQFLCFLPKTVIYLLYLRMRKVLLPHPWSLKSFSVSRIPGQQLKRRNFTRCPARRWLLMQSRAFSLAIAANIDGIAGHRRAKQDGLKHNYMQSHGLETQEHSGIQPVLHKYI